MGRVRKYKKIKACDPFAKTRTTTNNGDYDEPPELFEKRSRKKERKSRSMLDWDNEEDRERILQMEALRDLHKSSSIANSEKNKSTTFEVEKMKPNESLKSFNKRIREETKRVLVEEVSKMTKTAQKKKDRLKMLKQKKKDKKNKVDSDDDDNYIQEFGSRADGYIRPSDRGDVKPYFPGPEKIKFGEVSQAPPDLFKLGESLIKKRKNIMINNDDDDDESDEEIKKKKNDNEIYEEKKRKFKKLKLSERNDLDGDDKLENNPFGSGTTSLSSLTLKKKNNEPISHNKAAELEKLRQQAMASYKLLKEKRKLQSN